MSSSCCCRRGPSERQHARPLLGVPRCPAAAAVRRRGGASRFGVLAALEAAAQKLSTESVATLPQPRPIRHCTAGRRSINSWICGVRCTCSNARATLGGDDSVTDELELDNRVNRNQTWRAARRRGTLVARSAQNVAVRHIVVRPDPAREQADAALRARWRCGAESWAVGAYDLRLRSFPSRSRSVLAHRASAVDTRRRLGRLPRTRAIRLSRARDADRSAADRRLFPRACRAVTGGGEAAPSCRVPHCLRAAAVRSGGRAHRCSVFSRRDAAAEIQTRRSTATIATIRRGRSCAVAGQPVTRPRKTKMIVNGWNGGCERRIKTTRRV